MKQLYYDCLAEFKRQFYKDLLDIEHLQGNQVKIDKLHYTNGGVDEQANFWGYILEKNGTKFLLSAFDKQGKEIKPAQLLPIRSNNTVKVASRGVVYNYLQDPIISAKFRPISCFNHTNPDHQKLMWFLTLTQLIDRANYRISTPPGFGKDSTVDILGNLIGKTGTIENPTLAKLEERANCLKLLAINEVVDIKKSDWQFIEQFLLATGAFKPEITKHSRL